jgi:hypothetical protein
MDEYTEAHLFVAAIRVLQHLEKFPPNIEDVCTMLRVSVESGHAVCRNLHKLKIIEIYSDPFSVKLSVADHLGIEKLPKQAEEENRLARELEKFQAEKKSAEEKVATIQAEMAKKRQDLFADIEAKFKKELEKQKKG